MPYIPMPDAYGLPPRFHEPNYGAPSRSRSVREASPSHGHRSRHGSYGGYDRSVSPMGTSRFEALHVQPPSSRSNRDRRNDPAGLNGMFSRDPYARDNIHAPVGLSSFYSRTPNNFREPPPRPDLTRIAGGRYARPVSRHDSFNDHHRSGSYSSSSRRPSSPTLGYINSHRIVPGDGYGGVPRASGRHESRQASFHSGSSHRRGSPTDFIDGPSRSRSRNDSASYLDSASRNGHYHGSHRSSRSHRY